MARPARGPPAGRSLDFADVFFNTSGTELLVILLVALVVLGPERLPDFIRKVGRVVAEVRRMANGFQAELRDTLDEPTRELRETMDLARTTFMGDSKAKGPMNLLNPFVSDVPKVAPEQAELPGEDVTDVDSGDNAPIAGVPDEWDGPDPDEPVSFT